MTTAAPLIDVSRLVWRRLRGGLPTGVDRVCQAYLSHYRDGARAVVQWRGALRVLDEASSARLFDRLLASDSVSRAEMARWLTRLALAGAAPTHPSGALYLNIGHTGLDAPNLVEWIHKHRLRAVHFVHDLIPLTHPEYCRPGEALRHARRMQTVLRSGAGVIGNSQDTLDRLAEFGRAEGLPALPALAAPLAGELERPAAVSPSVALPTQAYFVMVGTIEARKNHLLVLQVWRRLVEAMGAAAPHLVIIGQRGWENEQVWDMLERCRALQGVVHEWGRCSDADMAHALRGARALLFPSFAEGYGMPLVESLAMGVPVIASPLGVFRALAGDIPDYRDVLDGNGWAALIRDFAQDTSAARQAQLARLAAYRAPTWDEHFARVDPWLGAL